MKRTIPASRMVLVGVILAGLVLVRASAARSEVVLRVISWANLKAAGQLSVGEVQPAEPPARGAPLMIANATGEPKTLTVLSIDDPRITTQEYAVVGEVRYQDVQGAGYLEMWSHFPDGNAYFTRTLASGGPLRSLEGSSDWRRFSLPFSLGQETQRPAKLVVNVVLPGRGVVYLGPLRLVQYAAGENALGIAGAWWDDRMGGWIGGLLGAALGCLGGLIGTLSGMGKARRLTIGLAKTVLFAGLLLTAAGLVAVVQSQPAGVWYPLLLCGLLSAGIFGGMIPRLRRRYEEIELRKMTAIDTGCHAAGQPTGDASSR